MLRPQPLHPRKPLGALAPALLCLPALCGELTLELCLAHRQRPLCRSRGALLDQPFGATAGLPQLGLATLGLAQRAVGLRALLLGPLQPRGRLLARAVGGRLSFGGPLDRARQPVALIAACENPLRAALRQLAHLPQ